MRELLRPVDLRIQRFHAQHAELAAIINAWIEKAKSQCHMEDLPERLGFRLIFDGTDSEPPLGQWSLLVGEYVHNMRSTLDNLAYALSRLQQDPPAKPDAVQFPIYKSAKGFADWGRRGTTQMSVAAADLIEKMQPFQRSLSLGNGSPEWDGLDLLRILSNDDKHRVPALMLVAPKRLDHSFTAKFATNELAYANSPSETNTSVNAGPLEPGMVLFEYRTTSPILTISGTMKLSANIALAASKNPDPAINVLGMLGDYVGVIVDQFRPFFEPKA